MSKFSDTWEKEEEPSVKKDLVKLDEEVCQNVWHLQPIGSHTLYWKMTAAQICQGDLDEKGHRALSYLLMLRSRMCHNIYHGSGEGRASSNLQTHNPLQVFIPQINTGS